MRFGGVWCILYVCPRVLSKIQAQQIMQSMCWTMLSKYRHSKYVCTLMLITEGYGAFGIQCMCVGECCQTYRLACTIHRKYTIKPLVYKACHLSSLSVTHFSPLFTL